MESDLWIVEFWTSGGTRVVSVPLPFACAEREMMARRAAGRRAYIIPA